MKKLIKIGANHIFEKNVIVGEKPARSILHSLLTIGEKAHLRSGTVIYLGSHLGKNLLTGHNVVIREQNQIGNNFSIWSNSVVDYGCVIGDNVKVHCNCYISQYTTLEDDVFLAPGVIVSNDPHPGPADSANCMRGPTIKKGAQIGCNVTLLPHITIGEHALIGAGSVVTKDVPPYTVAYGNPAKVTKEIRDVKCLVGNHFPYNYLYPH